MHLRRSLGKLGCLGRRDMVHLHPVGFQANIFEQCFQVHNPSFCIHITFQVMAVTGQSACDHNPVGTFFKGMQHHNHIQATGAG
jgi:hypothetical protein